MAGIYLHIPFCRQACHYCNFHFSTLLKYKGALVNALLQEIVLQKNFFAGGAPRQHHIETIYFGGGTPSLLENNEISNLLSAIREHFTVAKDCEITLEANPDDVDKARLSAWMRCGINRLSIGVQSFFDEDLKWMNRAHDARQAVECLHDVRKAGFDNFSADLIFGIPGLSDKRWEENIAGMTGLEIPHLSCYALTVEPRTPLDNFIRDKKYPPVSEEQAARQFEILMDRLAAAGYEHYEISNFARPGRRSKHNSHYWQGQPYLGVGPSAHSYAGKIRRWNVANNALYIKSIHDHHIPCEEEKLTPAMQWNEYIMTSLRTIEGCNLDHIADQWGRAESERLKAAGKKFILQKQMILEKNRLVLTRKGKLFADGIAVELFR